MDKTAPARGEHEMISWTSLELLMFSFVQKVVFNLLNFQA
jgi:hypothetical protein